MKIFVTGAAGFIGSRLAEMAAAEGAEVIGIDNLCPYYDPRIKLDRLERCGFDLSKAPRVNETVEVAREHRSISYDSIESGRMIQSELLPNLRFVRMDIGDDDLDKLVSAESPDVIVHLAAQPGVRYSINNVRECVESNVLNFTRILEVCKNYGVRRLLYASSSSVYGCQHPHPFKEIDRADRPVSVYAITKRTNEMLADVYTNMYGFKAVGMRFFSVYGEWGRPDMAPMLFARAILDGDTINLFNGGRLSRDFTYIDDVVKCICRIIFDGGGMSTSGELHELLNIGHGSPTQLTDFLKEMENLIGRKANVRLLPMQPGEVLATLCDSSKVKMRYGYSPDTELKEGLARFVNWIKVYNRRLREMGKKTVICDVDNNAGTIKAG